MLEEIKVNIMELFFANNQQTGLGQAQGSSTQSANKAQNANANNNSFMSVMNDLKSKAETNTKETKKSSDFSMDSKKIEPAKIMKAAKEISSDIKSEISNTGKSSENTATKTKESSEPIAEDKKSEDEEVNYLVLSEMKKQIDNEIEEISKAIAGLDLSTADGINEILELSDRLESLRAIEGIVLSKIEAIKLPSSAQLSLDEVELVSETSSSIKLENLSQDSIEVSVEQPNKEKVQDYIAKNIDDLVDVKTEALKLDNSETPILQSLDDKIGNFENNLKSIKNLSKSLEGQESESKNLVLESTKNAEVKEVKIDQASLDPKLAKNLQDQDRILMISGDMSEDLAIPGTEEPAMIPNMQDSFGSEMSDMEADSFNQQAQSDTPQLVQVNNSETKNTDIFKVNSRIQIHKNPVSLNELSNVLSREVTKVNPGAKQEITMSLTPGDLGQIELSISRSANNKLEIKMVFTQDNALNTVEHKLTELRSILKSRGFEAQIELSKSESTSTDSFNRPGQDSFNEAREEQKDRILDTMPAWLRPDDETDSPSFQSTLQQII
jgi:hypothetical protein